MLPEYSGGSIASMSVEKFSVSFEGGLAAMVRKAAAEEKLSVSSWLAEAAEAKARQRHLRHALDAFAAEHGALRDAEIEELVRSARASSRMTGPPRNRPRKSARGKRSRKVA
ncbi:MAG: hypothetical protein KF819_38355 [Labilithrix sp.]|nr:hypothetical protein [Labilithrix sp.]